MSVSLGLKAKEMTYRTPLYGIQNLSSVHPVFCVFFKKHRRDRISSSPCIARRESYRFFPISVMSLCDSIIVPQFNRAMVAKYFG